MESSMHQNLPTEEARSIALTIKEQIGWNALGGTAAQKFGFENNGSLRFRISNNRGTVKGWTYTVKITLMSSDTYMVETLRHRMGKNFRMERVHRRSGVYCDELHEAVYEAADYPNMAEKPEAM